MLIDSRSRADRGGGADGTTAARRSLLPRGVRTRVLVSFLALLVLSTAASLFVLREVLMSRIGDQVERELTPHVDALESVSNRGRPGTNDPYRSLERLFDVYLRQTAAPSDGALIAFIGGQRAGSNVADPDDAALAGAFDPVGAAEEPSAGTRETPVGETRYVAVPVSIGEQRGALVVTALTAAERDQVEAAVRIAIGVSIVVLLLASLFIWLAAGRAVAPLQALSRAARTISETDLSARIPVRGDDEIAELGRTFNGMLDRLETAFADQKDFLSDVSHELRTPITIVRGHLETLGDSPTERAEAIAVIQDELDRMSRYVDDLLLLTKASRPDFLHTGPVDLDLFTHELFGKARSLGERDWQLDGAGVGVVIADQQRITQAVMNLAENAVRHSGDGDRIWIGSSLVGDQARLWVRDEGPGIDPLDTERIFARYARAGRASQRDGEGVGLGLSIVRAIADAHGGRVELNSEPGSGSTFTIVIPAEPQA